MYQPGDPLKHVDWKVYGRTDRFYIKQYQEETNLRSTILFDISASMDFKSGGEVSKFEYGRSLAASLVYLLLLQRDAVGLTIFNDQPQEVFPQKSSLIWRNELWGALERSKPNGQTRLGDVLHTMAEQSSKRGLTILISDMLDDPEKILSGLHHFRHLGHEVLIFQILDPRELDFAFTRESRFVELETGQVLSANPWQIKDDYRQQMSEYIETIREGCARHNVHHHILTTDKPLEEALVTFLLQRQKQG